MSYHLFFVLLTLVYSVQSNLVDIMKRERELTVDSDYSHPCVRECKPGVFMTCNYTFMVDWYTSMSVQCGDCPLNLSHCANPGCIVGGGLVRPVISVNRRTPGPAILVCEGDTIVVEMINEMDRELLTIHWHGIHQVGTPYMDGGPYVTQCPIPPGDSFIYRFSANPYGIHMWHGHVGFHDSSGLFGPLIVKRQEPEYVTSLYDFDLPEHIVTIWHWYNQTDRDILPPVLDTFARVYGYGLLVNGQAPFGKFQSKINSTETISTPRAKFIVKKGFRYRFRLIVNSAIYCPVQISIDNHTLLVISTDTNIIQPVEVDSLMMNAGERFSLVVSAAQVGGCYWVRLRGLGDCGPLKSSTHGEAILCYNTTDTEPQDNPTYDQGRRQGKLLNPVEVFKGEDYSQNELILLNNLTALEAETYSYNSTPDVVFYLQLDARQYSEADAPGPWPQFNNITFSFPRFSLLTQRALLTGSSGLLCDSPDPSHCIGSFCSCTYTQYLPLGALVEIIMVDISVMREQDHPVHMHGYKFHVVSMGTVGENVSVDLVRHMNEDDQIPKKLQGAPFCDTISVPNAGYAVIRFKADNPGFWLLHCHVTNHLVLGMAMVLQVGSLDQMAETPAHFPTCDTVLYSATAPSLSVVSHSSCLLLVIASVSILYL